jgi:hypothetical protein
MTGYEASEHLWTLFEVKRRLAAVAREYGM